MTLTEYQRMSASADGPARGLVDITFDEDTVTAGEYVLRGVYNGSTAAGDVEVLLMDGATTAIIPNLPAGQTFPIFCRGVLTEGTEVAAVDLRGVI